MSSCSSTSSGSDCRHSKKRKRSKDSKRKHHKRKKDKHKHKRKRRNRDNSLSQSASKADPTPIAPPGAHELANALTKLFTLYPSMASIDEGGIPLLFIQLGRGTEYNLSHMPDRNLAGLLDGVFQSLRVHGMELSNGAWKWGNAPSVTNGRLTGDDLALLRLTRALLNGVGVNLDSVQEYEASHAQRQQQQHQDQYGQMKQASSTINDGMINEAQNEEDIKQKKRIERMTSQLLDRFDRPSDNGTSASASLAGELKGICEVIFSGESVQLDGLENTKLRASLSQLFELVGLELVEIEDEDEEDEEDEGKSATDPHDTNEIAMGYALPDHGIRDAIASKLEEVLRVCRFRSSSGKECAPTAWVSTSKNVTDTHAAESSDEDDGPAPLGTIAAVKAAKRIRQQINPSTASNGVEEGGREEWMMVPGEHDFLKGISKSDFRGRKFKNSKSKSNVAPAAAPINPEIMAEVQAIQQAYQESRGPSLLDAHRQNKAQQQQQDKKSGEWKWNREKNLDDGRRVDKNALHMVLGGASTELKSKFQSGS